MKIKSKFDVIDSNKNIIFIKDKVYSFIEAKGSSTFAGCVYCELGSKKRISKEYKDEVFEEAN